MSAIRFIKEQSASSVNSISITDIFNEDFDTYNIQYVGGNYSGGTSLDGRLINSSGSIVSDSNYDYARSILKSTTGEYDNYSANQSYFRSLGEVGHTFAGNGWIVNPYDKLLPTFLINQNSAGQGGGANYFGMKTTSVYTNHISATGLNLFTDNTSASMDITVRVYGLRVIN
tara:strand:+ start:628 stop:1143 length:516 start_codon:yes stop_codon:yes gene_type:complete